jgi:hypothetical protein
MSFVRSIAISVRYVAQTSNVRNILFRNGGSLVVVIPALMPVVLLKELRLEGSSLGLVFASGPRADQRAYHGPITRSDDP